MTAAWLGWRDVASRPARALLAFAVVAGCAAVFAFAELTERARDAATSGELDRVAAPLRVVPRRSAPGEAGLGLLDAADVARAREAGGAAVRDVEPWLTFDADVGGRRARIAGAPPRSTMAAAIPSEGVALGAALAQAVGGVAGSRIPVAGTPRHVAVLPAAGDADDAAAFVTLEAAQRALGTPGAVSELRVRLWPGARVDELKARLAAALPRAAVLLVDRGSVADVEIAAALRSHHLGVALATAIAVLGCLAIAAYLDASERRLELASLVALGATRRDLLVALAARSASIAVLAAGSGTLAAAFAAGAMGDGAAVTRAAFEVLAVTIGAAVVLGVSASLPSAIAAASRDPVRDLQEAAA